VFGRTSGFPAVMSLRRLFPAAGGDGTEGFVLTGIVEGDLSGTALGDVIGDGVDDLIIGAFSAGGTGESYVVFGRMPGFPAIFDLRSLLPGG
jgi:hypothetical protein